MQAPPISTPVRLTTAIAILLGMAIVALVATNRTANAVSVEIPCTAGNGDEAALVAAITAANTNDADDVVELPAGCTFDFTSPITTALGPRALPTILEDNGHVFSIYGNGSTLTTSVTMGLLHIDDAALVNLFDLVVTGFRSDLGGAIYTAGALSISTSTFSNNTATHDGGAIVNQQGTLLIYQSTFADNVAEQDDGGAIWTNGYVTIETTTFKFNASGNSGGGIIQPSGSLWVENSTFVANSAENNSDNVEVGTGSAIRAGIGGYVTSSTFSGNSGAVALDAASNGGMVLFNSVLIGNPGGNCGSNVSGGGGNVADNSSCDGGTITSVALLPLANYGGPTETMMLPAGHPAIGKGLNVACEPQDQRGVTRFTPCDSGAVERRFPPPDIQVEGVVNGHTYPASSAPTPVCATYDTGGGIGTPAIISIGGAAPAVIVTCYGATSLDGSPATPKIIGYSLSYPLPTVTVTGVTNGATYASDNVPVPGCQTTDAGGGILTSATLSIGGTLTNRTATCSGATNLIGQPATPVVVSYTVTYALPGVAVTGVEQDATYLFGNVPTPGCQTTNGGGGIGSPATLSLSTTNVSGSITATCSGATNVVGEPAPPVSVTYMVQCLPAHAYEGQVRVKQNATVLGLRDVNVTLLTDPATCDVTGVVLGSLLPTLAGSPAANTTTGWKAAVKQAANQWKFSIQSPSATAATVRMNNAARVLDGSTALVVKLSADRQTLYLKLTGMAPTGVGITKAGIEIETVGGGLLPAEK